LTSITEENYSLTHNLEEIKMSKATVGQNKIKMPLKAQRHAMTIMPGPPE
jgi:hypothetical protein